MTQCLQAALLAALIVGPASADSFGVGATGIGPAVFAQSAAGTQWTGASANGAEVSLLGPGIGQPQITCPYAGATWRISGGGIFSTALTPGTITPKIAFGSGAVSRAISNILASASNARWWGIVMLTCVSVGISGTMRATGWVDYATGDTSTGTAGLNNDGNAITLNNTGAMPIDIRVTMATQSASNMFRLDVLAVERVY